MPSLDRNSSVPYYLQVYNQIAQGIESGFYLAGNKLPSIRECARELGVSNTTVELAYQRLVSEGYVIAKRGSGYIICAYDKTPKLALDQFTEEYRQGCMKLAESEAQREAIVVPEHDFAYDAVDASLFPLNIWARISRDVFYGDGTREALLYNDRQGLKELRVQIAAFLNGEFGLNCTSEQVLVMPTTRDLVSEAIAVFDPETTVVAMEEPGYDEVTSLLRDRGHEVRVVPMHPSPLWEDVEHGLEGTSVVFTTPASQFPTTHVMPLEIRERIVKWAQEHDAYIIDDEYGWEFLSGMSRIPSLAVIDNAGHVITMGTFSNSFSPAVSLSYAVLPPQLMLRWRQARRDAHSKVPWQTQAAMAAFMEEGHWRTHIRKIRTAMQKKRRVLLDSLQAHMGDHVDVVSGPSSLYVLLRTKDGRSEEALMQAAEEAGVRVYPTSRYWSGAMPDDMRYVLVGFAGIPVEKIDEGIRKLAEAWGF